MPVSCVSHELVWKSQCFIMLRHKMHQNFLMGRFYVACVTRNTILSLKVEIRDESCSCMLQMCDRSHSALVCCCNAVHFTAGKGLLRTVH